MKKNLFLITLLSLSSCFAIGSESIPSSSPTSTTDPGMVSNAFSTCWNLTKTGWNVGTSAFDAGLKGTKFLSKGLEKITQNNWTLVPAAVCTLYGAYYGYRYKKFKNAIERAQRYLDGTANNWEPSRDLNYGFMARFGLFDQRDPVARSIILDKKDGFFAQRLYDGDDTRRLLSVRLQDALNKEIDIVVSLIIDLGELVSSNQLNNPDYKVGYVGSLVFPRKSQAIQLGQELIKRKKQLLNSLQDITRHSDTINAD